ncbi:hypothetical protein [Hyphomonas sp.]|uniref:hypothetical protein n=1 Tax=Hyphomonas sp. TaxID=87 RepID=UPI00391CF843
MADYYSLPPKQKKKFNPDWLVLLFLLLFLLGLAATIWSLRLRPGEIVDDPYLRTAALPEAPAPEPEAAEPVIEPEPEPVVIEAEPEPEIVPEPEPEAEPPPLFSDARWRETARFTGTDSEGRSAEFTAYVLVGDETWTFARADSIFVAGLHAPVETAFSKLDLGEGICSLSRVIAIGAASVEGTAAQNTFLSRARGLALSSAIGANLPCEEGSVPASILDLGYSTQKVTCPAGKALCPELSAPQRPIAMVLAVADDPDTDIGAALQNGISLHEEAGGEILHGVKVTGYSAFQSAFDLL